MRIVIAGQTYYPGNNGQAVFTIHLAEGLAELGHHVTVVVPAETLRTKRTVRNGVNILEIAAVHLAALHKNAYFTPFPLTPITRLFKKFQPDIVHLQDHYPLSRVVRQVAQKYRVPVIGTNHFLPENVTPYLHIPPKLEPLINRVLWKTVLSVYNRVDFVTTPTETAANILRRQHFTPPIQAVSCGVNLTRFHPMSDVERAAIRQRYGLSADKTITLFVGRIDAEKQLDVLVKALHRLNRFDQQVALVGQGKHRPVLEALVRELGLEKQVVFTGYVPAADLPALLNSVDIFAMPSNAELQSIATLEAMACGLPVLAADARALPELVENGVNGYLFAAENIDDAAQKLAKLVNDKAQWPQFGAASLCRAQIHSLGNTIRRYESLYFDLNPNARPAVQPLRYKQWASI